MGLAEEIQQGNLRLHELEEERVRLRKKITLMDTKVKNMEGEIKKYFLSKKTRMVKQGVCDHDDKVKVYCRELINLIPWLGPLISKHSDHGSTLQITKCVMPSIIGKGGDSSGNKMTAQLKLFTGDATT